MQAPNHTLQSVVCRRPTEGGHKFRRAGTGHLAVRRKIVKPRLRSADVPEVKPCRWIINRSFWIASAAAVLLAAVLVTASGAEESKPETYESLTIGPVTYSNVVVQTKTRTDLFIKHTSGFANLKVKDLDKSTQLQLGYLLEEPAPDSAAVGVFKKPAIEIDPRLEEWKEQIIWETEEAVAKIPPKIVYATLGGLFLLYLLFCNCCRLICRKTIYESSALGLVWFPMLKQIPLLKAAGLSGWCFLLNFIPPLWPILYIVWSFKIAKARGKSSLAGWLLLLPLLNVFAFLYLAFSRGANESEDDERGNRGIISLYQDNPRNAA
jgi:hypothetical protein